MLEQSCTFVNAYYGILDYEWLKPQYIGGTHKNTGCPIKINSGIIGSKDSIVTCGRDLSAQYLQNAVIEAQGDVKISNSIMQSVIYSAGNVVVNGIKGMIVGGYICALNGIDARIIGSQYGTKTTVEVGKDYLVQKKIHEVEKAIKFCIDNVMKIDYSW